MPIRIYGDPVLRRKAVPVREFTPELRALVAEMIETLYDAPGVGLAAPQVGVPLRFFVIDPSYGEERGHAYAIVNPVIGTFSDETVILEEGCLSIPELHADVSRPERLVIDYQTLDGEPMRVEADGMLARIIQHEYDHLDGILFIDRMSPTRRKLVSKQLKLLAKSQKKAQATA